MAAEHDIYNVINKIHIMYSFIQQQRRSSDTWARLAFWIGLNTKSLYSRDVSRLAQSQLPPLPAENHYFHNYCRCDHLPIHPSQQTHRVLMCLQPNVYKQWRDEDKADTLPLSLTHAHAQGTLSFSTMNRTKLRAQISQCAARKKNTTQAERTSVWLDAGLEPHRPSADNVLPSSA